MKDSLAAFKWADIAVSGIRFGPDRAAVKAELLAHVEDRAADIQRIYPDMTEEEAQERALSGMGDPEELKISLARVHRPWLGWLWTATRGMAVFSLLLVIGYLACQLLLCLLTIGDWEMREYFLGRRETAWSQEVRERSVRLEPAPERPVVDGCLLTMERVWLVEPEGPEESLTLQAEIAVRSPRFWVNGYAGLWTRLAAEDDQGSRYLSWQERKDDPYGYQGERFVNGRRTPIETPVLSIPHPFTERYIIWVFDVDRSAEELRLEYDWMGRELTMTVDLKEAGT